MRVLDAICGSGLILLGSLKVPHFVNVARSAETTGLGVEAVSHTHAGGDELLLDLPIGVLVAVAFVEVLLGLSFLAGRTPRLSALGLVGMGAVFSAWTVFAGPLAETEPVCGCFGSYRPSYMVHGLVAGCMLLMGGIRARQAATLPGGPQVTARGETVSSHGPFQPTPP